MKRLLIVLLLLLPLTGCIVWVPRERPRPFPHLPPPAPFVKEVVRG